ncbi:Aminoglycoside phosphotransferase [Sulfitobacter noctilucicola]|uniref:Plant heme peroxidase family profile domain-containing protein n=1 Tax=Sulfitobacter noctilucicola TaxID=1342301 RepID=A0A7W6M557_9RHOB|nr:phosphotransferase [Sulfitobacter noctilucicola]KIN62845.1 Aminoglycoside phosphotransferase [Sulfitobacter noctilucicola]MBB4172624.1 hypothetical protein [Sulfitobacter noctilucicola]
MKSREREIAAFLDQTEWQNAQRETVAGDASNRRYERLTHQDGRTAILMDAPPERGEDVRPFVAIADHLRKLGLSAPEIYHQDALAGLLVIEDFGDALFASLMAQDSTQEAALYQSALDVLLHLRGAPLPDLPLCDAQWLIDMTEPVFEWYAQDNGGMNRFANLFRPLAEDVNSRQPVLIMRDYHAQNLLQLPERDGVKSVGLLDFQDAMIGHPAYDLVSILQDARRDVSPGVERDLLNYYLSLADDDLRSFERAYAILGLQRNLRILGIFARLCLRDGKPQYLDFIPRVWDYIQRNLAHPDLAPMRDFLGNALPHPTPEFLESLKAQCPKATSQP